VARLSGTVSRLTVDGTLWAVIHVDRAHREDLEEVLQIAAARRQQYVGYQPQFWRPAHDAVDRQREFFASLLADDDTFLAVARDGGKVYGFALARMVDAPPVYDPGGPSCVVDDFAVADPADWSNVGPMLLDAVRTWGADHGATQLVVVVAQLDGAQRAVLEESRLTIASEWWVGAL
jgi:GNAT superfamily N-acetyltransferase